MVPPPLYFLEAKGGESNILAACEELLAQSKSKMKKKVNPRFSEKGVEIAQELEVYSIQNIFTPNGNFLIIVSMVDENK